MKIQVAANYLELSELAAKTVAEQLLGTGKPVLGLATGSTAEGMYARLVEMYRQGILNFDPVVTFNLDEYVGLGPDHPQSYHFYMHRNFFDHVNVRPENIHIPSCYDAREADEICRNYDQEIIKAGGIDLQLLGIGVNGHIGFNEPGRYLQTRTHLVELAAETIQANSRFFNAVDEVPHQAITMGISSIMKAAKILLLASGENKAPAVRDSFSGLVSTSVPASLLQLHQNFTVIADREAASLLGNYRPGP